MRILLALVATTAAAQIETQHAVDVTLPLEGKVEVLFHLRVRTRPGDLGLYQARGGPIFSYDFSERTSFTGGYYYATEEKVDDPDFVAGHRIFGGTEVAPQEGRHHALEGRVLYTTNP